MILGVFVTLWRMVIEKSIDLLHGKLSLTIFLS